jgi:hypothetical protein
VQKKITETLSHLWPRWNRGRPWRFDGREHSVTRSFGKASSTWCQRPWWKRRAISKCAHVRFGS